MSVQGGPDIVENGLILCYDPANIESYVSGSTTMYDLGSTGNTASLVGGVEYTGSFKGIFNFDGMNDYIDIARPSSISTSGSFSVCMFAKWKTVGTTTSSIQTLLDNNHSNSPVQGFVIQDRPELSKKLSFSVRPDQVGATSSFYVGNNNWYHIAGTHDGTVTRLYINGVLDGFVSQSGGISTVQPNITLARWQGSGGSRHMRGNIGQTLIYNRSISGTEVQQNYNAVKGRYPSIAYTPDTNFENVTLLLRGEGDNNGQNNTFIDSSINAFAITRNGNTTQGTFSPYGDNWSNYFDGTGDSLTFASNATFAIGTGQFTMEFWIQFNALTNIQEFIRTALSDQNGPFVFYYTTSNNTLNIGPYAGVGGGGISVSWTPNLRQWYHVAASRDSSNTQRLFIDGVLVGSSSSTVSYVQSGFGIFQRFANFNGYFSNFRFVNGTAIYTSNFAVPTQPLTAVPNTVLLTCQSNRFRDASSNNFALTRNGDVSVQRFSPFSPTVAYDARTIGGSGYFGVSNQYLGCGSNSAFAFGTGDFTVECWYYPTNTSQTNQYAYVTDTVGGLCFGFENNNFVLARRSQSPFDLSYAYNVIPYQWLHLVAVRSGTTASLFLNGTRVATGTVTSSYSVTGPVQIGGFGFGYTTVGYLSNLRAVKGTAVYDPTQTTLTVPTSPLTAITNTSLLLNFTNAAIIDSAMMNNLETVAEAQVETVVTKFGTGVLEFDGNGDYLDFKTGGNMLLGTGDFTVELWFYARASRTHRMFSLDGSGPSSYYAGLRIDLNGAGSFGLYSSNGGSHNIITSQGSWSVNTWTHLAITRSGNDFRFFKDGTQFYTVNSSHGLMNGTSHTIGMLASYNADYFDGLIDDFRVTRGIARYTSNFTPPAAALPDL